ncbi:MAG: hypothetical protein IPO91_17200 [Chloroflexi bacterium]|nr:hypothetical protein [Chloroflexota bacterium]
MLRTRRTLVFVIVALFVLSGSVAAQRSGGSRPAPSGSGGTAGSPGMSGAALNTGAGGRSGGQAGGGQVGGGQAGGQLGGQRGQGGAQGGERPTFGSGLNLSERGTGDVALELPFMSGETGDWMSRFGSGGFGTRAEGGELPEELPTLEDQGWLPESLPEGLPEAPGAFADLSGLAETQGQAQDAVAGALGDATEQAQAAAAAATEQAQQAYDQFWADYYTAVETTAQVYYDTMTATADYLLASYAAAVDYTTQTVDYYLAYAEQYAYYCALYPWDCYSYAYDAATNSYYYVGAASDAPSGTTTIGDVTVNVTVPISEPTPSAEAYEALVVFANDQLGAVIEPLYAGEATEAVQLVIGYLPDEIEAQLLNATSISGVTYWGLLTGGAGAVIVGDCSTNPANCAITADNLSVQLSSASTGMYGLLASAAVPTTPEAALALITTVYPKLDGLSFNQITDVEQGVAFMATTASVGYDVDTQAPISTAKVVYAGVVDVNGAPFVYAVVGVGAGYASLLG